MGTATRDIVTIVQRAIAQSGVDMTGKPEDIPQDIWDAAQEIVGTPDGLGYAKVFADRIARAIMAERASFRPLLTELYGEVVWNAYNAGIERDDGRWIDAGMSDAEQLVRDLGYMVDDPQMIKAMRLALPELIERKVDAAIRK